MSDFNSYDSSGDGVADLYEFDTNGDGYGDLAGMDRNQDGLYDGVMADTNLDGLYDVVTHDDNQNGVADTLAVDVDGDGYLDRVVVDANENGVEDSSEGGRTLAESIMDATTVGPASYDGQGQLLVTLADHSGTVAWGSNEDYDGDGTPDYSDPAPGDRRIS